MWFISKSWFSECCHPQFCESDLTFSIADSHVPWKSISDALHNCLLYFKFQRECQTSSQVSHAEEVTLKRCSLWESENASQSPSLWRHLPLSPKPYEVSSHKYSDAECKYVFRRRRRENTWTLLKIELVDDPFRWDVKLGRTLQACATEKVSKQIK